MASASESSTLADDELQDWMSKLPAGLWDLPLSELAIPGSHNSFSYSLDASTEYGPDAPAALKALGPMGKSIAYKWSVTQSLTFREQLLAGIRYLDLRVAKRKNSGKVHFIHTLYGMAVEDGVKEIRQFLKEHDKEVVILDFNHFYDMGEEDHSELLNCLVELFGSSLCLCVGIENLNLNMMWENGLQVVILYHHQMAADFCHVWQGNMCIQSPWANTPQCAKLMGFLDCASNKPRAEHFHVTQGILTPDAGFILGHLAGSLKNDLAKPMMSGFMEWLKSKERGKRGINIVIVDFIELNDFVSHVVMLNHK